MSEPALTTGRAARPRGAGASDTGRVRASNEDRLYVDLERGIFMVADGVGGHAAGEVAASIAIDVIVNRLGRRSGSPGERLRDAITRANSAVYRRAQQSVEHAGMTCVVTVALLEHDRLTIGHVGDSRLYKVTGAGIVKLTHDHSPVGEQEDAWEISEAEAMRHPRRNEVFRDVGSSLHAPDDPEFVEIVHTRFEPDAAILICSDGLSDMIPSSTIERIVRAHAGDPDAVVGTLVDAANDAGGRDNVTVVYVEGPGFSGARSRAPGWTSGIRAVPRPWPREPGADARPWSDGSDRSVESVASPGRAARALRVVIRSRATWLFTGALVGMVAGLASLLVLDGVPVWRGRVLVAGGAESRYSTIGAAMAVALPRDVVEVEPGEYAESVAVRSGVELVARVPGSVTLVAPPGQEEWTSLTVAGRGSAIRGIQVLGRPGAPVTTGMRVEGDGVVLDDTVFEGNIGVGIDVRHGGGIVIRSSRFSHVRGLPVRIGPSARPLLRQNLFLRGQGEDGPAVHVQEGAAPALVANVFIGYPEPIGAPTAQRQVLLRGNYRVPVSDDVGR
jgi:PPM family protein phosphatase